MSVKELVAPARQCIAMSKQSQQRCRRSAIVGGRVCSIHGGASPQARAKAAQRVALREALTLIDELPSVTPAEAFQRALTMANKLAAEGMDGPDALARAEALARLAKYAHDAGLAERRVRVEEAQILLFAGALERVLGALGIDARSPRVLEVIGREMRALEAGAA